MEYKYKLAAFISGNKENFFFRYIYILSKWYVNAYLNKNYSIKINGELRIIKLLPSPFIIFDVGACRGDWSEEVLRHHNKSILHLFEINESSLRHLYNLFKSNHVVINDEGLSETVMNTTINIYESRPGFTSIHKYPHKYSHSQTSASFMTFQDYCLKHKLDYVDFVKVDVEGMELEVLKGMGKFLRDRKIRVIQFEYGRVNLINKVLLKDFYDLLSINGYIIGKIFPKHVDFQEYSIEMEGIIGGNYLSVQRDDVEVIKKLR